MSYTKTNWTDGTTPVDANNMNKIEDALADQDERIDSLEENDHLSSKLLDSISDIESMNITTEYRMIFAGSSSTLTSVLTNGNVSIVGKLLIFNMRTSIIDYLLICGNGSATAGIYYGRISDGAVTVCIKYAGSSV